MNKIKMFFSLSPVKSDIDAIKIKQPKYLLLSYGLWREADVSYKMIKPVKKNKKGKRRRYTTKYKEGVNSFRNVLNEFHSIGYYPKIILDSGAYSFRENMPTISIREYFTDILSMSMIEDYYNGCIGDIEAMEYEGVMFDINDNDEVVSVSFSDEYLANEILNILKDEGHYRFIYTNTLHMNFIDQIRFIFENYKYVDYTIALDDMNSSEISIDNWNIQREIFGEIIPTYHIGEDEKVLKYYVDNKAEFICLGGNAEYRKKRKNTNEAIDDVAKWTIDICTKYPNVKFHLFGCQHQKLLSKIKHLDNLYSVDGATWAITGGNTYGKLNRDKVELLCELIDEYNII